jgi:hypothetical protein
MPELGPYGSVRGAFSNERPYRDSGAPVFSLFRVFHTAFTRGEIAESRHHNARLLLGVNKDRTMRGLARQEIVTATADWQKGGATGCARLQRSVHAGLLRVSTHSTSCSIEDVWTHHVWTKLRTCAATFSKQ